MSITIQGKPGFMTYLGLFLYLLLVGWLVCCLFTWSFHDGTTVFASFLKAIVEGLAWAIGRITYEVAHAIKKA